MPERHKRKHLLSDDYFRFCRSDPFGSTPAYVTRLICGESCNAI